jgi:hypothetical protein
LGSGSVERGGGFCLEFSSLISPRNIKYCHVLSEALYGTMSMFKPTVVDLNASIPFLLTIRCAEKGQEF